MNLCREYTVGRLAILTLATIALFVSSTRSARAQDLDESRAGVSLGGRATYDHSKQTDNDYWSGGAQLRLHFNSMLAVEGSVDYRQTDYSGTIVDNYPVQASLMLYLIPGFFLSPYVLGGGGWYFTHIDGGGTSAPFAPHAGAGLEAFLSRHWSVDGSWRYIWNENVSSQNAAHPLGQNFSDHGYMVTAALNYRF